MEILDADLVDRKAHVSTAVVPECIRTGVGLTGSVIMIGWVYEHLPIEKLAFSALADNSVLIRSLDRLLAREGVLRRELMIDGVWHDLVLYAMFREDYGKVATHFGLPGLTAPPPEAQSIHLGAGAA